MEKKVLALFLTFFLFSPLVLSQEEQDYRPSYSFGDYPFEYLLPFPEDFFEIKSLLSTQSIIPSTLSEYYYQPELIFSFEDSWVYSIYSNQSSYSKYGMAMYPSRIDVFNLDINESVTLSLFVYSQAGVRVYQGTEAYLTYDPNVVSCNILTNQTYILSPTYPKFIPGWLQLLEFEITMLDYGTHEVDICERKLSSNLEQEYKALYGNENFITGGSVLGLEIPRAFIYVSSVEEPAEEVIKTPFISSNPVYPIYILIIALIILAIGGIAFAKGKKKPQ